MAQISTVQLTNTFDTWRTRTNESLTRINQFAVTESSLYANNITANVALNVLGTLSVHGQSADVRYANTTTFNSALANTNSYIATTASTERSSLANTNAYIASVQSDVNANEATERAALANTNAYIATKSPTASPTFTGTTTDNSNALSQTLTDGATISWNIVSGRVATVTLGGNRTVGAPTNLKVGTYILKVIQDGTGSRTLTWHANFKWTAGVAPTLSTAAASVDIFSFFSDGTRLYGSFLPDMQ